FRSFEAVSSMMPLMFASSLLGFVAVAYIFAKGHEGGSGVKGGVWFGIVLAGGFLFLVFVPSYAIFQIDQAISAEMAVAGGVELVIDGVVLGLVYKPAPSGASARAARV